MAAYRLDPINLTDPRWQASSVTEMVWAGADSPDKARELVASKTLKSTAVRPGAPMLISPWYDDQLATCVWEPSKKDVPKGTVVTADGKQVGQR